MMYTEHMRTDPAYRERLRAGGLDSVSKVLTRIDGRVAAWSRTTDTLFVPGADGTPGLYVKRHYFPSWVKRLRGTFRGTFFGRHRGQSEYLALNAMRAVGIPAVRAVAYGERRAGHFLTACFLITEEVPGARNLTTFAFEVATGRSTLSAAERHLWIRTLADQLAAMHATGVSHGNLFWRNLLVRGGPDGRPEFFFLDPQPLRAWERFGSGGNWWLRELAQLAVSALTFTSRSERLRFLRNYLGGARLTPEIKEQIRQIERLAQTWRRHEERRIRMNSLFEEWNRQLAREERRSDLGSGVESPA
ncbi:MAG: hypothetical protein KAY37_05405 [Phycisphaerae bacterium]|nr:hypothetical protein [Phycisphaerae bacterium]